MTIIEALEKGIPVKTSGGQHVRLVAIMSGTPAPVVVAIQKTPTPKDGSDPYYMENYYPCGKYNPPYNTNLDLHIAQ